MKYLSVLFLSVFFFSQNSYSQCEAPILTNWHVDGGDDYEISFSTFDAGLPFVVKFSTLYEDSPDVDEPIESIFTGITIAGNQQHSYDLTSELDALDASSLSYYFKVDIASVCDLDTLWSPSFYMSEGSVLNNQEYLCEGELIMPFDTIPDGTGNFYSIDIEIDAEAEFVPIFELSILVDIGHSYNGDLSIELISPEGTSVSLLAFGANDFGNSWGMSVLFLWGADQLEVTPGVPHSYVSGIYNPNGSFYLFNDELLSGTWTITITDNVGADEGVLFGICLNAEPSPCLTSVSGDVFYDLNSNNILDVDEPIAPFSYITVEAESAIITNGNGHFDRCYDPTLLTMEIESPNLYYSATPENYELILNEGDFLDNINFALHPISEDIEDLQVDILIPLIPDRPGFDNTYSVTYNNIGTACVDDVELIFSVPEGVEIVDVITDLTYEIDGGVINFLIGTLCPFENGEVSIIVLIEESVEIGDELIYEATISPAETDENGIDNQDEYLSVVVGSYDPNDKAVSHEAIVEDFIDDSKKLEYLVRFQNTGTFYAEKVEIIDEIEEDLILNTLEIIDSSHPMEVFVEGNELHFVFEDIFLPAEEDDPEGSNGYVRFKMQPSESFGLSDEIHNTAEIYFDFNDPIITNTAITVFDPNVGVSETELNEFNIYPNPVKDKLMVDFRNLNSIVEINILNLLGEQIMQKNVKGLKQLEIDLNDISDGSYILELINKNGENVSRKFVKL